MSKSIFTTFILLSIFFNSQLLAQVELKVTPCQKASNVLSREELKNIRKGIKGKKELPSDFFTKKVAVYIVSLSDQNVRDIIEGNGNEFGYSLNNVVDKIIKQCEKAKLDIAKYIVYQAEENLLNPMNASISTEALPEEYLKIAKENGAEYIMMVSSKLEKQNDDGESTGALIYSIHDRGDFYLTSLGEISKAKSAKNAGSYVDGGVLNKISKTVEYGGVFGMPKDLKLSSIYFVNFPNLVLPKDKGDGMICKMMYNSNKKLKEDFLERNKITKTSLKACSVKNIIVDEAKEIPKEATYQLKYYPYTYVVHVAPTTTNPTGEAYKTKEYFYLENPVTKKVYLFKEGPNDYGKYLKKVIKEING